RGRLVALAELDADGEILWTVLLHDLGAEGAPRGVCCCAVVLEIFGQDPAVHDAGASHAQLGVANAHPPALNLVAFSEPRYGPTLPPGRELPAQIHHVADAGVHPQSAERREQMCGVAG